MNNQNPNSNPQPEKEITPGNTPKEFPVTPDKDKHEINRPDNPSSPNEIPVIPESEIKLPGVQNENKQV